MSSNLTRPNLEKVRSLIEVAGRLTIGLSALCYVLGLLVLNIYLSKYGVYSLSLFRLNYITAGLLALSPILFGFIAFLLGVSLVYPLILVIRRKLHSVFHPGEELAAEFGELTSFGLLLLLLAAPVGIEVIIFRVAGGTIEGPWGIPLVMAIVTNILCAVATCFGILLDPDSYSRKVVLVIVPVAAAVLIIGCSVLFASSLYEKVPPHLGGGEPKEVELFVNSSESRALLEEADIEFIKNTHTATNVRLLFTTDDEYILLVKVPLSSTEQAVTIKRELIQGVRPKETFPILGQ